MSASPTSAPDWLTRLIDRSRRSDAQPPFSDQSLVDLRTGARQLVAIDEVAAALVSSTEAEFVVDPDARGLGHGTALLEKLLAAPSLQSAGAELLVWAHGDHPAARALAASHGLEPIRELLQLSADLSSDDTAPGVDAPASGASADALDGITAFQVGQDEDDWLALNARAFASHPEQGRVSRADLDELIAEDWFDADDFLLLRIDGELVGYCWLKVTGDAAETDSADGSDNADNVGEFYVVGVDPQRQGEGLGRRLTVAGLAWLRQRGIRSSHLYVDGDNTAAVKLYRSLGFVDHSIDIQYRFVAR